MNCLSKLAYCKSADLGGLAGGILLVMLLEVELPVLWPLVVLRFEGCLCVLIMVGFDEGWPSCCPSHSPCCLGIFALTPAFAAVVLLMLPEEEEEERREEIGGFDWFGEVDDNLVVAGITAGSSLSRAAPLEKYISLLDEYSPSEVSTEIEGEFLQPGNHYCIYVLDN